MIGEIWALSRRAKAPQVLVVDDFVPGTRAAARLPRAAELLRALAATGAQITVLPTRDEALEDTRGYPALRLKAGDDLGRVLATRLGTFAAIIVSRAHNMAMMAEVLAHERAVTGDALIVYDAEIPPTDRADARAREEIAAARRADVVLALEASTAAVFKAAGHPDVRVLGYPATPQVSPPFGRRSGLLMVAPTYGDPTPFADAVAWFGAHVLPLLRQRLDRSVVLVVAGEDGSSLDVSRSARAIVPLGRGTDPRLAFERSRVFVVPPPAAGALPLNLYDAAALGVSAVLAPAQARRVGWVHGAGALVAGSADEFAAACIALYRDQLLWEGLVADARGRLAAVCDRARFDAMIGAVLLQAVSTRR